MRVASTQDELYEYSTRVRRTSLEVLADFPSCRGNVPLSYIFDLFPPMKPRQFSIASSHAATPDQIHLCVAIVEYKTRMATPRTGVCTAWLRTLRPGMAVQ
jgi:sulfite reductase alpha subunit-like flavoprotein